MKPVIGVVSAYDYDRGYSFIKSGYYEAIRAAGGIPVILPMCHDGDYPQEVVNHIDGLLLTGGCDVDPALYGEGPHRHLGMVSPERDRMELKLIELCAKKNAPVLAICRGIQVLNVAFGGTLYQHIPDQVKEAVMHDQGNTPSYHGIHSVDIVEGSVLYRIVGKKTLAVNSFHHQAVKKVASCLKVVGRSQDGVIEAVEGIGSKFLLGVQWHPERMWERSPENLRIFEHFVKSCYF